MPRNRNKHRRNHGQGQGQHQLRHDGDGLRPNTYSTYRPHSMHRPANHFPLPQSRHPSNRGSQPVGPGIHPYQLPLHYPEQQFHPQVQQYPLEALLLQQQVLAVPPSRLSSTVSIDSLSSSDTVPFVFPPNPTLYNIFTDPYFLDDLEPPGVDPENWYEESMRFIEESGRYQRPETSIDAGTGWMGDIQQPDSDSVETQLVDGLQEFSAWQEAAEGYEWNLGDVENDFVQGESIALQNENNGYQQRVVVEDDEWQG